MAQLLQVRGVPDPVRQTLKARAAARGVSLNAYLLDLLARETERLAVEEVLARAAGHAECPRVSALDAVTVTRSQRDPASTPSD